MSLKDHLRSLFDGATQLSGGKETQIDRHGLARINEHELTRIRRVVSYSLLVVSGRRPVINCQLSVVTTHSMPRRLNSGS